MSRRGDLLVLGLDLDDGNMIVLSGNLTLAGGNLIISAGTFTVSNNVTLSGDLTVADDVTMTTGDLLITAGNITLTAGDITLTLGDFTMTDGNALLTSGNLTLIAGNIVVTLGDVTLTNGNLILTVSEFIKGQRFSVTSPAIDSAAIDNGLVFWIAPAACKFLSAYSSQEVIAGQTCTVQLEKLTAAEAQDGSNGDDLLAAAFNAESTADTPVSKAGLTSGVETFAAGDRIALMATGTSTSLVGFISTSVFEWL